MSENPLDILNAQLKEYLDKGFHMPGVTVITERPEFMRHSFRIVQIDAHIETGKVSNDEIYSVGSGKYAFGRLAIGKFADAGRIELKILGTPTVVRGKDVARYSAKISGERYELDGAPKRLEDEKTYDLCIREEEMRIKYAEKADKEHSKWSSEEKRAWVDRSVRKLMIERQKFASEMAITGAQARVVTKMLGLKPAYTLAELGKPFVIVSMTPVVDMLDPDIKRLVTLHMLGIKETLYPVSAQPFYQPQLLERTPLIENAEFHEVPAATEPVLAPAEKSGLPSLSDFVDCPRGTKVRILHRVISDEETKQKLSTLEDPALTSLYEGRLAA